MFQALEYLRSTTREETNAILTALAHLGHADLDTLLIPVCDKLHIILAIVTDLRTPSPAMSNRFNVGQAGTPEVELLAAVAGMQRLSAAIVE